MASKLNILTDEEKQALRSLSVDDIFELYRTGRKTLGERDNLLDTKFELSQQDLLDSVGFKNFPVKTFMRQVDIITEAWNNLRALAQEITIRGAEREEGAQPRPGPGGQIAELAVDNLRVLFNGFRVLFASLEATFQVAVGRNIKNALLLAGAPPAVARGGEIIGEFADVIFAAGAKGKLAVKFLKTASELRQSAKAKSLKKTAEVAGKVKEVVAGAARETLEGAEDAIDVARTTIREMLKTEGFVADEADITKLINQGIPPRLRALAGRVAGDKLTQEAKSMKAVLEKRGIDTANLRRGEGESLDEAIRNRFVAESFADPRIIDELRNIAPTTIAPIRITASDTFSDVLRKYTSHLETQKRATPEALEHFAKPTSFTMEEIGNFLPGTIVPSEQIEAVVSVVLPRLVGYIERSKKAILTGNTAQIDALIEETKGIAMATAAALGVRAETGRALRTFGEAAEFGGQVIEDLNKVFMKLAPELGNDVTKTQRGAFEFLSMVAQLDPDKAMTLFLHRLKPSGWEKFQEVWRNLLLPLPISIGRNIAGPVTFGITNTLERAGAGMVGKEVGSAEFFDFMVGMYRNYFASKQKAVEVFFERRLPRAAMTEVERGGRFVQGRISGTLGKSIRLPQRTFGASDEFFNTIFSGGDLYARAATDAVAKGLRRGTQEFENAIAHFIATAPSELIEETLKFGRELTLTSPLGPIGRKIQGLVQHKFAFVYSPFFRTFADANKAVFQRFPGLALLSSRNINDIAKGGRDADFAAVRIMESFLLGTLFFSLARSGQMTGGGPKDPDQNRRWRAMGNTPYSFGTRFGDVPYLQFLPYSIPMAIIADTAEGYSDTPNDATEAALAGAYLALTRIDHTLLENNRNIVGMVDALTPETQSDFDKVIQVAQSPVVTIATGGPLGSAILDAASKIVNPEEARIMREAHSLAEEVRRRFPNPDLTPLFDDLGRVVLKRRFRGPPFIRELLPLITKPREKNIGDDALDVLNKLNVGDLRVNRSLGSAPTDNLLVTQNLENAGGIRLADKQFERFNDLYNTAKVNGKTLTERVIEISNDNVIFPTDAAKRQGVLFAHQSALSLAKVQLFKEFPDLFGSSEKAKARAQLEFVPENIRPQLRLTIENSIDELSQQAPFEGVQLDFAEPGFSLPPVQ